MPVTWINEFRTADKTNVRFAPYDEIISPQRYYGDDEEALNHCKDSMISFNTKDLYTVSISARHLLSSRDVPRVRFSAHDEIIPPQLYYDDDEEITDHCREDCKDSVISFSTPIAHPKDIHAVPISTQYLLKSRIALRSQVETWEKRSQRALYDPPHPIHEGYALKGNRLALDTTIFTNRPSPRLSYARKVALGMKVENDTLARSMKTHVIDLKGLGAVGRNKMHFYREAKRAIRRNARTLLPALVEEDDNEADNASTIPTASFSSYSLPHDYPDHCHNNDKVKTVKIIYRGCCVGTVPKSELPKFKKWDRKLDKREERAMRKVVKESRKMERKKREEKVKAWGGEAAKWMGGKIRAAATRVVWQDWRCGRYGCHDESGYERVC